MAQYVQSYDPYTGKFQGVNRDDGRFIPSAVSNADWRAFLQWNSVQAVPLDLSDLPSGTARKPRSLFAIYTDIGALTAGQKTNVWNDLTSGSPPKITQDVGVSADSIFLLWRIASNASLPAATITDMKITAASYYVRDNPAYLVNPTFDPTINIPGDQPA